MIFSKAARMRVASVLLPLALASGGSGLACAADPGMEKTATAKDAAETAAPKAKKREERPNIIAEGAQSIAFAPISGEDLVKKYPFLQDTVNRSDSPERMAEYGPTEYFSFEARDEAGKRDFVFLYRAGAGFCGPEGCLFDAFARKDGDKDYKDALRSIIAPVQIAMLKHEDGLSLLIPTTRGFYEWPLMEDGTFGSPHPYRRQHSAAAPKTP